ncbi:MAG: hypothetical protein K0R55_4015 [Sporomusa sp.]|jgi:hypothetical protein|nr:hypothetical protein [Sporomusa sp.]
MFWVIRFILFWAFWLIFADKSRWKEMLPVCSFAAFLGAFTDIITHHYAIWIYDTEADNLIAELLDDVSVYPVVVYLFLQWLPEERTTAKMLTYWILWTAAAIMIEWFHVVTGHMSYNGWNIGYSYISDWFLFWLFYKYHSVLDLPRLNRGK